MINYHRLAQLALILAVFVIMLGAYTRLTDAGLGCPDWPGCYGQMVLPHSEIGLSSAQQSYPDQPIVAPKAWTEMVHRYVAGTLGILIVILAVWSVFRRRHVLEQPLITPFILVGVLIFQAILGMWTVTLKLLPLVVTGHLLGGMAIAGLLAWLASATRNPKGRPEINSSIKPWVMGGLLILIIQLFLGAWTSTNYSALACGTEFPGCLDSLWPQMNWLEAFNILSPVGPNYEGGRLAMAARVTIQMAHRYGALITFLYLGSLSLVLLIATPFRGLKLLGGCLLLFLCLQIMLGIMNVVWLLPLGIAVAHNGLAVLLLITTVFIYQRSHYVARLPRTL